MQAWVCLSLSQCAVVSAPRYEAGLNSTADLDSESSAQDQMGQKRARLLLQLAHTELDLHGPSRLRKSGPTIGLSLSGGKTGQVTWPLTGGRVKSRKRIPLVIGTRGDLSLNTPGKSSLGEVCRYSHS